MNPSLDYIESVPEDQKTMMFYLYDLFMQADGVRSKLSYGLPFFYGNRWICYLNPGANGEVEVGFPRGHELANLNGLLQSRGRKMVKSVVYSSLEDIDEHALLESLAEALELDRTTPGSRTGKNKMR